ncbi:hypothetical protein ABPG75_005715 [Micractinium tetrahymenae]
MRRRAALRCAALLLLHALALASVRGLQPTVNPRGWQAAKEAERRAATARVPTVQQRQQQQRRQRGRQPEPSLDEIGSGSNQAEAVDSCSNGKGRGVPALPPAAFQQTCSLSGRPESAALQAAVWRQLVVAAAAAFVLGLLCGTLLHAGLHRWWPRRHGRAGRTGEQLQSAAGSCIVAPEQRLPPAGAVKEPPAGSDPALLSRSEAADAAEAAGSTLAAAAAAASAAESEKEEEQEGECMGETSGLTAAPADVEERPAAAEAAVAAAVQELVLQQSAGSGSPSGSAAAADAAAAGIAAAPDTQQQQQQQQQQPHQLKQQRDPADDGAAPLAIATAPGAGGAGAGALSLLRHEDQADVAAAAQLVLTMCRSMHVDPGELSRGERLQLIYTMLQAWQAQQARRHGEQMHRLGSEANVLRSEQRDIAAAAAARQAAKDAYRLSLERTAEFRRMCSDTLTFGLAVMLAAGTYQLLSRGLLAGIAASCGSLGGASGSRWGLWAAWRAAEALACHVLAIGDALLGLAVLLAAPWLLYRSGLMSDYHAMPVSKLFIGLGLVCGLSGWLAVGKLGGSRAAWLAAWEAWVVLHIALSAAAHRLQCVGARAAAQQAAAGARAAAAAGSMYDGGHGWLPAAMWVGLGLVLPALAGTLPFR